MIFCDNTRWTHFGAHEPVPRAIGSIHALRPRGRHELEIPSAEAEHLVDVLGPRAASPTILLRVAPVEPYRLLPAMQVGLSKQYLE
jgi:hypothetical protein